LTFFENAFIKKKDNNPRTKYIKDAQSVQWLLSDVAMVTSVIESKNFPMKHHLMEPEIFWHIWRTQDVSFHRQIALNKLFCNLKILKKLAECRLVCRASRSMIDSWRGQHGLIAQFPSGESPGWVGEHPLFERYRRNAEEYIVKLDERMRPLWRFPEIPDGISTFDSVKLANAQSLLAVQHLSHALGNHGRHKAFVRACLAELRDIVAYTHRYLQNNEKVIIDVIWPLIRVVQSHHGDTSLGMLILQSVLQIAGIDSSIPDINAMLNPLVSPGRSFAGRRMLWAFYNSCPNNKDLEDTVGSVMRWLEYPVLLCHSAELHTYVYTH